MAGKINHHPTTTKQTTKQPFKLITIMKKTKNYLFAALLIPFSFALVASGAFSGCNDKETPVKLVTFDNTERQAMQFVQARDYQLDIVEDSLLIFDGNRYVGAIPFHYDTLVSPIDSLIMKDNE